MGLIAERRGAKMVMSTPLAKRKKAQKLVDLQRLADLTRRKWH
jgi:hypothetical protein